MTYGSVADPDPHQSDKLDPDPHQSDKLDLDPVRINLQMASQKIWNMSRFEHFFMVLSLHWVARIRIRIHIRVMRIRNTAIWYLLVNKKIQNQ